mmetsp:Transcript_1795/g.5035  ORF Transcript_1795/g.5035 Transcript_1795/m.5035 type:complete len:203 (-) Transcript_1795:193-801(-)
MHLGHLDDGDAQGPYVRLLVVGPVLDEFGRHPQGRADDCPALTTWPKLGRDAEVTQLARAVARQEQVGGLDVAVDEAQLVVQVLQSAERRRADRGDLRLGERRTASVDRVQAGAGASLHGEPQRALVAFQVGALEADDVNGVALAERLDLAVQGELGVVALPHIEQLDGDTRLVLLAQGAVDDTVAALADGALHLEELLRVA